MPEQPDLQLVIDLLRSRQGQSIVEHGIREQKPPEYLDPERQLNPKLIAKLGAEGVTRLYTHQATAFDLAEAGNDVLVTTGTSSGKTLCYNLPVLQRCYKEPAARALYIFPTKALAQDQLGKLRRLAPEFNCETYDGDTPKSARPGIRQTAHIVLTNPDMLHLAILPNFSSWARFFRSLRYVVLDEMHAYSGVFGSHVALIMRRLRRLCEWQGSKPQVIACSATIANGAELFEQLVGKRPEVVSKDGAMCGKRHLIMWNPPEREDGRRASAHAESAHLLATMVWEGLRTIAFTRSRLAAEIVLRYAREGLMGIDPKLAGRLESYRAGYTPKERREIEKRLFKGDLMGLAATDAMELGIDVGDLDAVVMDGYPGSIGSLRQQTGRAGRSGRDALGILVARDNPLEQYYMRHPDLLLGGTAEAVKVHPSNPFVLSAQLRCAAHERPIAPNELDAFPPEALDRLEEMEDTGEIVRRAGLWIHPKHSSPAAEVDIRGGGANAYTILCDGEILGTLEEWRAFQSAHPEAVYLHRGEQYVVTDFDEAARTVRVIRRQVDYYTQPMIESEVQPVTGIETRRVGNTTIKLCWVNVRAQMTGYRRKHIHDDTVLAMVDYLMPPHEMSTIGLEISLDDPRLRADSIIGWSEGVHAFEHLLVGLAPGFVQCDARDLGSTYTVPTFGQDGGRVYIYDGVPGGIGFSEALMASAADWYDRCYEQLSSCGCEDGCPACVLSPWCPSANDRISRLNGAIVARFSAGV